ncbi:MAG: hypothetical protein CVU43_20070 [Chloroflexi bacterium HGW-Chloroflexi-5]|jgi:hypothetical protein|nr:MAG: hypothetical protein CVU43_20070 [Chloroflexi bacterium HGW-Chloroflexi-5]
MSATLESALESPGNEEQFGLNLQIENDVATHPGYTTVYGRPQPKAKSTEKQEGISDLTLIGLAIGGFFEGIWKLFLYINLWYVAYPFMLFVSFYMSQILLKPDLATLTPIRILSALAAGCAGLYYAYQLLITFVSEHSDPTMYFEESKNFLLHITVYSTISLLLLKTSGLLNPKTFLDAGNQWLFVSFYTMYLIGTSYMKFFNYRITVK